MATAHEYSLEQLNYLRVCKVTTGDIAEGLRQVFKQSWDTRYQATHGQWQDTAKNGIDLYSLESARSRRRNSRELAILRNGNRLEWDCTCLFFAILYSDSIGTGLDPVVRKGVDDLRQFRNKVFAHASAEKISELDFQASMQTVIDAFTALKLNTADIEGIKNQKTFPTEELRVIQQELEKEKRRNEEPRSFCVLPPKPSHEVIDRSGEVNEILDVMKRLKSEKTNEITVVYLSGNPGCGKSELSRQIGEKVFDDVPENVTDQVNFVFALNASSTDTLIQSYVEFAVSLNCDENSATSIGTSKDLSQEDKLVYLKSLVVPKLRRYSSWLLIVDNVTDVKSVFKCLPQVGEKTDCNGQMLVTTQDSRSLGADDPYSFHSSLSRGMKPEEATRVLSEISGIISNDECPLTVAKALDFQPLALACAATYMKRVRSTNSSISWEDYLQKLEQGKREATEGEYKRISVTYSLPMTAAVRFALENEMAENLVMMHAFQFLSVMAPERIPLEYVVKYVTQRLPGEDEDLVATTIFSSSLVLCSEDLSKEIGLHQVVHSYLQCTVRHKNKEEEFYFFVNVIHAFSALLNTFNRNNVNHIITTRFMAVHFIHLSNSLNFSTSNSLSNMIQSKHFQEKCKQSLSSIETMGDICQTHAKHEAALTFYKIAMMMAEHFYGRNHPTIATTLGKLGNCLVDLGKHKEAQKCHERALAIQEMAYDANHPTIATTLVNLGNCLVQLGKHKEAQKCHERALAIQEMAYDHNHPNIVTTLGNLGNCLVQLGKHKEAQKCHERALAIQEMAYDANHPTIATTLVNLGNCLVQLGKHEEGQKCHERALAINEMAYDAYHPNIATTLVNLGNCLRDLGKHKEAQKCHERALAINEMAYDANHPTIARTLGNLGNCLNQLGKHKEAQKCHERALAIKEMAYDANHPTIATTLVNLGNCLVQLGKDKEAQKCHERALAIQEMAYDANHPNIATTLGGLGNCLDQLGKHKEAQKCHERALAIEEMAYDANHPTIATTLVNLGNCLVQLGKHKEAQKCHERALAIQEMAYDHNHPNIATTLGNLGNCLNQLGKHKEAQKCHERALAIQEMAYDANHPTIASTLVNLGNCLVQLGKHEEAQKCHERALAIQEMAYDANHPTIATTLVNLGNCLVQLGKHEEGQKCHERALAINEMAYDAYHPNIATTLVNLGNCLRDLGKHKEAQKCHERALAINEMAYDANHPTIARTLGNLGNCLNQLGKHKEAQKCHERALAIKEMAYDANHPTIATTLVNLGNCLVQLGKHKEAQKCHERALAIAEMVYDVNHPMTSKISWNLKICLDIQEMLGYSKNKKRKSYTEEMARKRRK